MDDNGVKEKNNQPEGEKPVNDSSGKKKNKAAKEKSFTNNLTVFFNNIKAEFKKIVWPSKEDLIKQTMVVIVICLLVGMVIFSMDYVLNLLLTLVTGLIG